jgi:hypothetical protein
VAVEGLYVPFLLGGGGNPSQQEGAAGAVPETPSEWAAEGARIGQTLRIRLPEDFTVTDGPEGYDVQEIGSIDVLYGYLHVRPEWCAGLLAGREVHSRWLEDYSVTIDEMLVRYDACSRELAMPRGLRAPEAAVIARAEELFADQLAEVRRRVREGETEQASFQFTARTLLEAPGMANSLLTFAQITRQAVQLFRNSNAFLQNLDAQYADVGSRGLESEERAMGLLKSWLTDGEWESLESCGYFEVVGSAGGRFRLYAKDCFGVRKLRPGKLLDDAYCVVPDGAPALGDILLAQKIALETDEERTLQIANRRAAG